VAGSSQKTDKKNSREKAAVGSRQASNPPSTGNTTLQMKE